MGTPRLDETSGEVLPDDEWTPEVASATLGEWESENIAAEEDSDYLSSDSFEQGVRACKGFASIDPLSLIPPLHYLTTNLCISNPYVPSRNSSSRLCQSQALPRTPAPARR
jgi:hypothetical protein